MINSMKEALRRRRSKGVDISIVLGGPDNVHSSMHGDQKPGDEDEKDLELAPEVENESADVKDQDMGEPMVQAGDAVNPAHPDEKQDMALIAKLLGKDSLLARHLNKK